MSSILDYCAELEAEQNRLREARENQPLITCPGCGAEYEDFDGIGLLYCRKCGYCRHASITAGQCDYCGKPEGNGRINENGITPLPAPEPPVNREAGSTRRWRPNN